MKVLFKLFITFFIVLNSAALVAYAQEDIVIAISDTEEHYAINKIANEIISGISQKTNMKMKLIALPAKRAIRYLRTHKVHADIGRIEYFENIVQDTIKIKEIIIELTIHAYSANKQIVVDDWDSLEPLEIASIDGRIFNDQFLYKHKKTNYINSIYSGLKMLEAKHVDIYIDYSELVDPVLKNDKRFKDSHIIKQVPPLELMKFYVFFSSEYPEIAKKFEKAFIELKEEGTYQKIISKYLKN